MSDSPGAGPSRRPASSSAVSDPLGSLAPARTSPSAHARRNAPSPLLGIPRTSSPAGSAPTTPLSAISSSSTGSKTKRRPKPLVLDKAGLELGQDEERSAQLEMDGLGTARSAITITTEDEDEVDNEDNKSDLSQEIDNLSLLRRDVQANLRERPLDSPLSHTTSDTDDQSQSRSRSRPTSPDPPYPPLSEADFIPVSSIHPVAQTDDRPLILDIRPLGAYLSSHLPGSIHLAIPSLLYKRYRRYEVGSNTPRHRIDIETLGGYVTPQSERAAFEQALKRPETQAVLVASAIGGHEEEAVRIYKAVLSGMVREERVKIVRGGWTAVLRDEAVLATLHRGDTETSSVIGGLTISDIDKAFPPPKSAPLRSTIPTFNIAPPPIPSDSPTHPIPHKQSMPSLRTGPGLRRKVPALSIQTAQPQLPPVGLGAGAGAGGGRPPKLSLNLDRPTRSNTTGQYPDLHLNVSSPMTGTGQAAKTPIRGSFQSEGVGTSLFSGEMRQTPSITDLASPTATFANANANRNPQADSEPPQTASLPTARNAIAPFIVSTILPSFLYLGPEITSQAEIKALKDMGVKRILNVALECEDDQDLGLSRAFDKYTQIPMRDIVEETGVNGYMRDACDLLDDARLHSAPVYVHCKAGKSRSVTVVLAYLIHANAWTLKTAYAYVAERRRGISPNIGFVAELMQFEEAELGIKQSAGVHGEAAQSKKGEAQEQSAGAGAGGGSRANPARGSLPPAWVAGPSSSLDTRPPERLPLPSGGQQANGDIDAKARTVRDEREVMKNGQWVQHRRAPVDRMTLQPGRRASKAGLESLRNPDPPDPPTPSP